MKITFNLITLALLSLFACQQNDEPASGKTTLKLTFNGVTRVYSDARFSEGKLGSISSITVNAGSSGADYLSLSVYGSGAGTYPYKQDMADYHGVSQVEYKINGKLFNNYFAKICPAESGYYSTTGQIKIDEYVAGKRAKGTFTGALLDAHSEDECNPSPNSFSGEFDITLP
ncbi:hypothetical protein [Dyadobacter crusticola]|uniref:hypothetical protein n=1 Tax=Dyadobacter crusticola TaxID=292407 RepID=UPI0004E210A5|nr:hypothetical protein [Dyadobacter crusticola]